jgi:DNA-binding NtrC family response regulator
MRAPRLSPTATPELLAGLLAGSDALALSPGPAVRPRTDLAIEWLETRFSGLIRLHRHSLSHLMLAGGTARERERIAFAFHRGSPLRCGPFVRLDCDRDEERLRCALEHALSAVTCERPDDPLRESEGGTLLLDHASFLPLASQHALLRLLARLPEAATASWPCFSRLAVGSAAALEWEVAAGRFDPGLLDMVDKIRIELPSACPGAPR